MAVLFESSAKCVSALSVMLARLHNYLCEYFQSTLVALLYHKRFLFYFSEITTPIVYCMIIMLVSLFLHAYNDLASLTFRQYSAKNVMYFTQTPERLQY